MSERKFKRRRVDRRYAPNRRHRGGAANWIVGEVADPVPVAVQGREERRAEDSAGCVQKEGDVDRGSGAARIGGAGGAAGLHRAQRIHGQEELGASIHF